MKNESILKNFVVLLSLLAIYNNAKSQDFVTKAAQLQSANSSQKNTVITIDDKQYDYRVLKYYSQQDLVDMPAVKRNQIYFIYTQSYHVIDIATCPTVKISDIDVAQLEIFRKEDISTSVLYGTDCKVSIQLISRKELNEILDVIASTIK